MVLNLKPEFLKKNGKEFVVLTTEEFERVTEALEDAQDLRILRDARRRNASLPTYSLAEVKSRLKLTRKRKKASK
jgi:PHD/YefM family antitoxin component YafN of YafNO toxin-antitoxin module